MRKDLYLLELVRYIHLNPLPAGIVKELDQYPYCGYSVLMGKNKREWQDADYILKFYNSKHLTACRRDREYVEKDLGDGRKPELVGGGAAQENLYRKSQLEAAGYSFDWLVERVAQQLDVEPKDVLAPGKYAQNVKARSLLRYWGTRELGMTTVDLARRLNLAQPTVSQAVTRGQKIVEDRG